MPRLTVIGLDDLERLAARLAALLEPGDVLLLAGDLGAGKTTFTGALARALDIAEPVRSPTYTVAHEYAAPDGRTLAHLDLYRHAGTMDDEAWGDLEPLVDAAHVAVVEWPDALAGRLDARRTWRLHLDHASEDARVLAITPPPDAGWTALVG